MFVFHFNRLINGKTMKGSNNLFFSSVEARTHLLPQCIHSFSHKVITFDGLISHLTVFNVYSTYKSNYHIVIN